MTQISIMELEVTIWHPISNGWFEINYRVMVCRGRNSIIQADAALYDGVNECLIRSICTKRC
jgi:hypothetical protein